ncbi:right-handed parallel beta-helix repeat-containing protein [Tunicatimonas pelagia]|uniref:right-handed parallel beta-helix repeat-containing protein n=1 Tax=Tunicatimonas pelagia TaxID=931531 RepID=UPI002666ED02|nr:right-handed parallel beta-helix repeat-containing protein [Tunicatimonas pelagia]WKN45476.1 right-handed parallel beta-helix repeat-containing protein [Tunicatimonas pelagia]
MVLPFTTLFTALLATLITTLAVGQVAFYVSPTGSDNNTGANEAPFRTLKRVQQAVREARLNQQNIEVLIRAGEYFLNEPLRFGPEDGGSATQRVTYQKAGEGEVLIHSGKEVSGWQASDELGIYQAQLSSVVFRQLYVDGQKAIRARYPNASQYLESSGWDYDDRELILKGKHEHVGEKSPHLEMVLLQSWAESYLRVRTLSSYGLSFHKYSRISFAENETDILFNRPYPMHGPQHRVYFENARQLLDTEQEWYHDIDQEILYYQPPAGADMNQLRVMYPTLDTLLVVQGTADNPVTNLHFEGLSFQYTNWTYANTNGYVNAQTGQHNYRADTENNQYVYRPPAAVYVAHAHQVAFRGNEFKNLGSAGLDLHYGTRTCSVVGNQFHAIAGSAVSLAKFTQDPSVEFHIPYNPTDTTEICYNDTVANNLIERVATEYFGCVGIAAGYPNGAQITHNVIRNLPYSGISVGFGWTDQPNAMANNLIAYNDVSDVVKLLNDGAAIYTLSYQPGTRIYRNYLHDIADAQAPWQRIVYAIYCDEKSGGSAENPFVIQENVVEGVADRLKLHQSGIMRLEYALHRKGHRQGKHIVETAGLEPEFRHLLNQ